MKFQGWDLSLNHGGIVEFTDHHLSNFWYVTRKKTIAKQLGDHALYLDVPKHPDPSVVELIRLNNWERLIITHLKNTAPDYVGLEDYAFGKSMRAHQIGELGGLLRLSCFNNNIRLRLHDPLSIKMFVANNGHAKKPQIEKAVLDKWGQGFSNYNPPTRKGSKKQNREVSEDLADAFGICKLISTEIKLRLGELQLKDLHPKEIQVFNRVTKKYPVSLLGRDWICKDVKE